MSFIKLLDLGIHRLLEFLRPLASYPFLKFLHLLSSLSMILSVSPLILTFIKFIHSFIFQVPLTFRIELDKRASYHGKTFVKDVFCH